MPPPEKAGAHRKDTKTMKQKFFRWLKRRHWAWFVIPYVAGSALSTMPTFEGVVALAIEWTTAGLVFLAWRLEKTEETHVVA